MKYLSLFFILLASYSANASLTFNECGCDRYLANGLWATKESASKDSYLQYSYQFFCSASEEIIVDTVKKSSRLGLSIPEELDLTVSEAKDSASLRSWRNSHCGENDRRVSLTQLRDSYQTLVDENLVTAANECFRICKDDRGGLFCNLVDVDETYSIFTVSWAPIANQLEFPKVTGGELIGGEFVKQGFSSAAPIDMGVPISVTGIGATIKRNDPTRSVSLQLVTDNGGSCSVSSEPAERKFIVSVEITPQGMRRQPMSKPFRFGFGNPSSCTEGWREITHSVCLDDGGIATSINGPINHSQRHTGRSWAEIDQSNPSCANIHYGYSDEGRNMVGDCKGNGWIDASWTLTGYKLVPERRKPYIEEQVISVGVDSESAVHFTPPYSMIDGLEQVKWNYSTTVSESSKGVAKSEFSLSREQPRLNGAEVIQGSHGSLTVVVGRDSVQ